MTVKPLDDPIEGVAAPFRLANCDTDMIIPKQFLTGIRRTGLSEGLFYNLRFDEDGNELSEFVLNREPYRHARILVGGENFGCGSSREHAPWALQDFGFAAFIAPSFADIFRNNCIKNCLLPIELPSEEVERILEVIENPLSAAMSISLHNQTIAYGAKKAVGFEIDAFSKLRVIAGLDEIGASLAYADAITAAEVRTADLTPWLHVPGPSA